MIPASCTTTIGSTDIQKAMSAYDGVVGYSHEAYRKIWNSSVLTRVRNLFKVLNMWEKSTIETDKLGSSICFTDFIPSYHFKNKITKEFELWVDLQDRILGM